MFSFNKPKKFISIIKKSIEDPILIHIISKILNGTLKKIIQIQIKISKHFSKKFSILELNIN